jgi:hypothetical protein
MSVAPKGKNRKDDDNITLNIKEFEPDTMMPMSCTWIIVAPPGSGKCHGIGTKVIKINNTKNTKNTKNESGQIVQDTNKYNLINVEDIKKGDQILGDDGTPRNIIGTCQRDGIMRYVENKNNVSVAEIPVTVRDKNFYRHRFYNSYSVNDDHIICCLKIKDRPTLNYVHNGSYGYYTIRCTLKLDITDRKKITVRDYAIYEQDFMNGKNFLDDEGIKRCYDTAVFTYNYICRDYIRRGDIKYVEMSAYQFDGLKPKQLAKLYGIRADCDFEHINPNIFFGNDKILTLQEDRYREIIKNLFEGFIKNNGCVFDIERHETIGKTILAYNRVTSDEYMDYHHSLNETLESFALSSYDTRMRVIKDILYEHSKDDDRYRYKTLPKTRHISLYTTGRDETDERLEKLDKMLYERLRILQTLINGVGMNIKIDSHYTGINTEIDISITSPYMWENKDITLYPNFNNVLFLNNRMLNIYPIRVTSLLYKDTYYGFEIDNNSRYLLHDMTVTHNTSLMENFCYYLKHIYPVARIFVGTETGYKRFCKIFPPLFVSNYYDEEEETQYIIRQKTSVMRYGPGTQSASINVIDDSQDKKFYKSNIFENLFKLGSQHWCNLLMVGLQAVMNLSADVRKSVSFVGIGREPEQNEREKLYKNLGGITGTYKDFCTLMNELTGDYHFLIIKKRSQSNNREDNIYWFKTRDLSKMDWKFGCKEYRKWGETRYNKGYVEKFIM